jgi:peptidoglycan hydrolase CwlO-like protein
MENQISNNQGTGNTRSAAWILSAVSAALLVVFAVVFVTREHKFKEQRVEAQLVHDNLSGIIEHRDSIINDLVMTFNAIEKDMNIVRQQEDLLATSVDDPEFSEDVRERIVSDIRQMNTLLEENRAKVKTLNRRLKESGVKIAALEEKIVLLEASIAQQDSSINVLKAELVNRDFLLADLNTVIDSLDTEVVERDEAIYVKDALISQNQAELDKAYLVSGNYKELEEKGVVAKEGGFLGLGRSKVVTADLIDSEFDQIRISQTDRIAINAKKVELISNHPEGSYQVVSNDSIIEIQITVSIITQITEGNSRSLASAVFF